MRGPGAGPRRRIRVLVVDDSAAVRASLRTHLAGDRIEIVGTSPDGDDAIAQAVALRPDVVTMDLMMPGTDGVACIERLMLVAPTRVIVVTSSETTGTAAMRAIRLLRSALRREPIRVLYGDPIEIELGKEASGHTDEYQRIANAVMLVPNSDKRNTNGPSERPARK